MSRSVQCASCEWMSIAFDAALNCCNFRVKNVSIQSKAMRSHFSIMKSSTETIKRELLVRVIALQNRSNRLHGKHILIPIGIPKMKRLWLRNLSITQRKVHSNLQANFTATKNIIQKWFFLLYHYSADFNWFPIFWVENEFLALRPTLIGVTSLLYSLVISIWIKFEKLELQIIVRVAVGQRVGVGEDGVPRDFAIDELFAFALVNWCNCSRSVFSWLLNHEKDVSA